MQKLPTTFIGSTRGGKVFGPYQKIARTNRSNRNETGWLDQETILYHHSVDNTKEGFCSCFGKKDEFSKWPLTFYKIFFVKEGMIILIKKKKKLVVVLFGMK